MLSSDSVVFKLKRQKNKSCPSDFDMFEIRIESFINNSDCRIQSTTNMHV